MSDSSNRSGRCAAALGFSLILTLPALAQAGATQVRAHSRGLADTARALGKGNKLVVKGLTLDGQRDVSNLELERFDVWRPDAVVEVDGQRVTPPATAYFRGKVVGDDASTAVLSVRESGEVQGIVQKKGQSWLVGKGRTQKALHSRQAKQEDLPPFECGNDDAFSPAERLGSDDSEALASSSLDAAATDASSPVAAALNAGTVLNSPYVATIAIDTDYEYYAKFGNTTAALDYMADLIGYADVTYSREVSTDMQIGYSRLWTTGAANDPWTVGPCVDANGDGVADVTPCGTSGALAEFRSYWNANMTGVNRTVAHQLSGRSLGGGIAYIGVLCQNWSGSKGSTSDYGVSSSLGGNFNWDGDQTHNPAQVVWDIIVVQHEIGHNFNSPHTHDYCNIGGSTLPIDNCWSGCQSGATVALPSCTSTPTAFHTSTGGGAGTIMSYCHQRTGGYGNISMTFGQNHPCGTLPNREADRMKAHVVARATTYPSCFTTPAAQTCGNGVIDAGEQCDGGNLGGATCSSKGFASGTLSCSSSCTFNTSQCTSCGNGRIDAGEVCDGTALGSATCSTQGCTGGTLGCNLTCSGYTKTSCTGCPVCDGDGTCEAGENCNTCPSDCPKGTSGGARCGNGICEAGNGEDCLSCPSDCNGVQSGKPTNRYCCGDGAGTRPVACSDRRCSANARTCTTVTKTASSFCCGDAICQNGESCGSCALDCTGAAEICGNGIDDNCNAKIDCSDSTCSTLSSCTCKATGSSCSAGSQCCSGSCSSKGTCN